MEELMLVENPYWNPRRRRRRRNPTGGIMRKNPVGKVTKEWFMDVQPIEVGAALGGLAASTMLPSMFIKDTTTTGQKLLKLVVSLACAAGAGYIFQNVDKRAGQMAVAGGLAGTLTQALAMFANVQIGKPSYSSLPVGRGPNRPPIGRSYQSEFESAAPHAF